jgi:signal transduction histidine kinase
MRAELEVAQRLGSTTDWPALADDLLLDTARLSKLVDDLLLLARSDASAAPSRTVRLDLSTVVKEVADRYPSVTLEATDCPLWILAQPDTIGRVVANLLDNAVRHTRTGVWVTTRADGADQVVTITDDGPGIPEVDRDRVFERFTRLDDGRARDAGGAGLGLAIVRELVSQHRGRLTLGDAGPGLRVELRFPATREGGLPAAPPAQPAPAARP